MTQCNQFIKHVSIVPVAAALLLLAAPGCEENTATDGDAAGSGPTSGQVTNSPVEEQINRGSGSTLGKARDVSRGVINQAEEQSRELAEQYDDYDN